VWMESCVCSTVVPCPIREDHIVLKHKPSSRRMTDSDRVVHCMADSATTLSTETPRFERCRGLEVGNRAADYDSDARHTNHRTAKTDTAWLSQWPTIAAITEQGGMNGERKRKRREESG
jgi:hypothetical protein